MVAAEIKRYRSFCEVVEGSSSLRSQLKAPEDERPWYVLCVQNPAVFKEMFPTADKQTEAKLYLEKILAQVAGAAKSVSRSAAKKRTAAMPKRRAVGK